MRRLNLKLWRWQKFSKHIKHKKGNVAIFDIFIFMTISIMLMYITVYLVDILLIFIKYQELNNIVNKYSYIIQEYGSLTPDEENKLYMDLKSKEFNLENLEISIPEKSKEYGELAIFSIKYKCYIKINFFSYKKDYGISLNVDKAFYIKK